jgi:hypothetical protein
MVLMEALTPASPSGLPPLGELILDDAFWNYPAAGEAREGAAHLRVWLTTGPEPGHLAVITDTGPGSSVTQSAGHIRQQLARRHGAPLLLLEHHHAPPTGAGEETLDLVRISADGSPHRNRIWPSPEDNPRHAGLELWMATDGYRIVSESASWFDRCQDAGD